MSLRRRSIMFSYISVLILHSFVPDHATAATDQAQRFRAIVGDYTATFDPLRAYTLSRIEYRGETLGLANGNYGFTFHGGDGKFIGGSHDEAGAKETVIEKLLHVDGKEAAVPLKGDVTGRRVAFVTRSKLKGLLATQTTIITPQGIERELTLEVAESTQVGTSFAFMHPWTADTTQWIARERSNEERLLEGKLDSEGRENLGEITWAAVYDPTRRLAVLTIFPPDNLPGEGTKHWIWDIKPYHKQYYQPFSRRMLETGETYRFRMEIQVIPASPSDWIEVVKRLAPEYEGGTHVRQGEAEPRQVISATADAPATPEPQSAMHTKIMAQHPPIDLASPPPWLSSPVAMRALDPDTVLEPWSEVEVKDGVVSVWGRQHALGPWALPKQITALGEPLLAAPIRLEVSIDGAIAQPEPLARQTENYRGKATFRSTGHAGKADVQVNAAFEYDGFIRYNVALDTKGDPVTVDQLELVIPLEPDQARFMQHASAWRLGMSQQVTGFCGAIPEGQGEVYTYGFSPFLWVGGYDRGLSFSAESDQYWFPEKSDRAIRVVRSDDAVELRIVLIDGQTELPADATFTFALMATPVKPLPEGWRSWRITTQNPRTRRGESHDQLGDHLIYWNDKWRIVHQYPIPRDLDAMRSNVDQLRRQGADRFYAYLNPWLMGTGEKTHIPDEDFHFTPPEWTAFGEDWAIIPGLENYVYQRVSPASAYADFTLGAVKSWITEGGINGVYLDESFPYADTDARKGQGYTDREGRRQPTYALFAVRDFYKRLAYLFQTYGEGLPAMVAHTSATYAVPYLSFADIALTGEQWYHTIRKHPGPDMPSYIDLVPLEDWHAEMRSVQFGMVPLAFTVIKGPHLTQFPGIEKDAGIQRDFLTLALLHDTLVWANFGNNEPILQVQRAKDDFGMNHPQLVMHPYWQHDLAVDSANFEATGGDVRVTYYTQPGRSLVVLGNLGASAAKVSFTPSMFLQDGHLSTPPGQVFNAEDGSILSNNGERTNITVPPRDFRLIRIEK